MQLPFRMLSVARRPDAVFLLLLVVVYVLAAVLPAPRAMVAPVTGVRTSQLVLALMLFVAGLRTEVPQDAREVLRRGTLIGMGVLGRVLPLVVMLACVPVALAGGGSSLARDIAAGLTMVAAMPTANTSAAWTRRSSGDLTVCAGIVVATTMLSPLVIPVTLALIGGSTGEATTPYDSVYEGFRVIGWVVVPILAGITVGRAAGLAVGRRLNSLGTVCTLGALLLLNYLNASQALPSVLEHGGTRALGWAACGAAVLVPLSFAAGDAAGRCVAASPAQARALAYAAGMSNTGLASTLAVDVFRDQPATLYPIVLCTLLQHVAAALVHIRGSRSPA